MKSCRAAREELHFAYDGKKRAMLAGECEMSGCGGEHSWVTLRHAYWLTDEGCTGEGR